MEAFSDKQLKNLISKLECSRELLLRVIEEAMKTDLNKELVVAEMIKNVYYRQEIKLDEYTAEIKQLDEAFNTQFSRKQSEWVAPRITLEGVKLFPVQTWHYFRAKDNIIHINENHYKCLLLYLRNDSFPIPKFIDYAQLIELIGVLQHCDESYNIGLAHMDRDKITLVKGESDSFRQFLNNIECAAFAYINEEEYEHSISMDLMIPILEWWSQPFPLTNNEYIKLFKIYKFLNREYEVELEDNFLRIPNEEHFDTLVRELSQWSDLDVVEDTITIVDLDRIYQQLEE